MTLPSNVQRKREQCTLVAMAIVLLSTGAGADCGNFTARGTATPPTILGEELGFGVACLILVLFGGFALLLAWMFNFIRSYVYKDRAMLDTDFDAGGRVSLGLTATTIVSQWIWAATLLQSSTVTAQNGISGAFWYAAGATIPLLLFATTSVQLKTRAPGAKTFLQVIQARFGSRTHLVFCFFAILANVIVTAMLMLGGCAVLTSIVGDLNLEFSSMVLVAIIGGYTFIGGLGATFYMSYFNTAVIFAILVIFLVKIFHIPGREGEPIGSIDGIYQLLNCSVGPDGNHGNSYLTFRSLDGLVFGIINVVGNFGTVFVDQSYWQSSVAAKPKQGMWGFLLGGLVWFAVPFAFATTMGLSYIALSTYWGQELLTLQERGQGLVPAVVANEVLGSTGYVLIVLMILMAVTSKGINRLVPVAVANEVLGRTGYVLIVLMILMAVTSTGSAEVIAITSIVIYDLYQIHLKPYRRVLDSNSCILCGKSRGRMANPRDQCECTSMAHCGGCSSDDLNHDNNKRAIKPGFRCTVHGSYRTYLELLKRKRDWAIVVTSILFIPLTLICYRLDINLEAMYYLMGVMIGSSVIPIVLCMFWSRLTGRAMELAAVAGLCLGVTAWLVTSIILFGEFSFSKFLQNTTEDANFEFSMLSGNLTAIISGGVIAVLVSVCTQAPMDDDQETELWEKTRDIDNPLSPWTELYIKEFAITERKLVFNRPSLQQMKGEFKKTYRIALVLGVALSIILVVVFPALLTTVEVFSMGLFRWWIALSDTWAFIAAIFIILVPVATETFEIVKRIRTTRGKNRYSDSPSLEMNSGHLSTSVATISEQLE